MLKDTVLLLIERNDFFMDLLIQHLQISLTAIGFAVVLGLLIGILISEYEHTSKITLGIINFIYTIPAISLLGFLIPFSGIGNTTAIIALTIYALLPMVRNTYTGFSQVDKTILEAAKGMGSTRLQILYKIKFPLALPVIMSGVRNMVTMTIALTGIASFIGAGGLGVAIYRGITTNNAAMTTAGSLLIALLAIFIDLGLGFIEKILQDKRKIKRLHKVVSISFATIILAIVFGGYFFKTTSTYTIRIATKPMTEQLIIGEILQLFIEQETDLQVELTQGVGGGTSNILPAMLNGEFDLYPEYTGTGWNLVLGNEGFYDERLFNNLQRQFQNELGLTWMTRLGFNNTFGLAVSSEMATEYDLTTFSDLVTVSNQLTFGAEPDFFEREDGYPLLVDPHGFNFNQRVDLDIGLKYQAINEGQIDAMNIFTTDGQLSVADVVVLEDDLQIYPSYRCQLVARTQIIEQFPELKSVLIQLEDLFTDQEISKLNYLVEVEGQDPQVVAKTFLQDMNLLK